MNTHLDHYLSQVSQSERRSDVIAYLAAIDHLLKVFPKIGKAILQELRDQRSYLKLIASENFSSLSVQLAMGNLLTDKYSEGYPLHRFYAGCENVDTIEEEACTLAKRLFGAEHAYVQPHSGADANLVAFWAILVQHVQTKEVEKLGKKRIDDLTPEEYEQVRRLMCSQKILGLSLGSGGHLTHGYRHNVSSKMMQAFSYDVDPKTGLLNYDTIAALTKKYRPRILLAGYSSYPRLINFAKMREIADEAGAVLMVDMAHFAGLVAGKVFKGDFNPIPFAHLVTSTTHKTLRGPRGGIVLSTRDHADILNKGCPLVLGGPLPHVMAAKALAFQEALVPDFCSYAQQVVDNAKTLAATLVEEGLAVFTGGTDNHLVVFDVSPLGLTGRQAETILREAGMTVNRNMIPFDKNGPWYCSGIRVGTPALTTLGMKQKEMQQIGKMIATLLKNAKPKIHSKTGEPSQASVSVEPKVLSSIKEKVQELLTTFPLYSEIILKPENGNTGKIS